MTNVSSSSSEHGSSRKHPWHVVQHDDDMPGPDGWRVWCIPHGSIGVYASRVQAYLAGLEHDFALGGDTWK